MHVEHPIVSIALAGILGLATVTGSRAQHLGLEAGVSAVENHDSASPSLGLSLGWPMGSRFEASLGYVGWFGGDANRRSGGAAVTDGRFFGNHALVLGVLGRAWHGEVAQALLGAGVGQMERLRRVDGRDHAEMEGALVLTGVLRHRLGARSRVYLRGDVAAPTGLDLRPRWGFFRVGVDLPL